MTFRMEIVIHVSEWWALCDEPSCRLIANGHCSMDTNSSVGHSAAGRNPNLISANSNKQFDFDFVILFVCFGQNAESNYRTLNELTFLFETQTNNNNNKNGQKGAENKRMTKLTNVPFELFNHPSGRIAVESLPSTLPSKENLCEFHDFPKMFEFQKVNVNFMIIIPIQSLSRWLFSLLLHFHFGIGPVGLLFIGLP